MRPRIVALAAALLMLLVTAAGLGYADRTMVTSMNQQDEFSFMPGSNDASDTQWARENHYINLSNWVRQGLGPNIPFNQITDRHVNPNRIKVLTISDSFSWGTGAANLNERWQNRLQAELDQRAGAGVFEVQTLGIMGASTMEEAEILADNVESLDPDLIVVGLVSNDMIPSGRERSICGEDVGPDCSQDTPELLPDYRECVTGKADIPSKLISVLGSFYPNLSKKLLDRYCDLERFAKQYDMVTQQEIRQDPKKSPHRAQFLQSVLDMKAAAAGRPIYAYALAQADGDVITTGLLAENYAKAGIKIIPASSETQALNKPYTSGSLPDGNINPADFHPGPRFTKSFSEDIAAAVLAAVDPMRLKEANSSIMVPARVVVSNFLPVAMTVNETAPGVAIVDVPEGAMISKEYPTFRQARNEYPAKDAPCAYLGHPHAFIGLNPGITESGEVTVDYLVGPELTLYVGSYDAAGRRVTKLAGPLRPGRAVTISLDGGGNESLYVADRTRGCSLDERHTLAPFQLRVSVKD